MGVVTGRDLAQLCRERYSRRMTLLLWIACDVAEVVGNAVALQMLFGVSLATGVLLSAVGTFAMLALQRVVTLLILFVGFCFVVELALARPVWSDAFAGFMPPRALLRYAGMLWLAAGILGAMVMPHNLYLHSSLVKNHVPTRDDDTIGEALRGVNIDTFASLGLAFIVNASLLVVAAAVFHAGGYTQVDDLADAHRLIALLFESHWVGIAFAAALLAGSLNATVTGTLAGQAVMEGFLRLKMARWARALLTRALAAVASFGQHGSNALLVATQVMLSLQLPLSVIPLVRFASDARLMGRWRVARVPLALA